MQCSTVTQKGQVTIPVELRKALHIQEGDKVVFIRVGDSITLTAIHPVKLSTLDACLPKPKKALSVEDMNRIIEDKQ